MNIKLIGVFVAVCVLLMAGCGKDNSAKVTDDSSIQYGWAVEDGQIESGYDAEGFYLFPNGSGVLIMHSMWIHMSWSASAGNLTIRYRDQEEGLMGEEVIPYEIVEDGQVLRSTRDILGFRVTELYRSDIALHVRERSDKE